MSFMYAYGFFSRAVKVFGENRTVHAQRLETLVLKLRLAIVRTNSFLLVLLKSI